MMDTRTTLPLSLTALALLLLGAAATQAHAQEVALVEAAVTLDAMTPGGYCPSCYSLRGEVEVANLAYDKQVSVYYSKDGGPWQVAQAQYLRPSAAGHEIWRFVVGLGYSYPPPTVHFAVRYEVLGQVYWDNNTFQDYQVDADSPIFPAVPVRVASATKGGGLGCYGLCADLSVDIRVENIAYDKQVTLVYAVGGGPWSELEARYRQPVTGTGGGYELWRAYLPYIYPPSLPVEFAVRYRVAGQEHWDNADGYDYVVQ